MEKLETKEITTKRSGRCWLYQKHLVKKIWICLSSTFLWGVLVYWLILSDLYGAGRILAIDFNRFGEFQTEKILIPVAFIISIISSILVLRNK